MTNQSITQPVMHFDFYIESNDTQQT